MTDLGKRPKKPPQTNWGKALTLIDAQNELGPLKTVADVERWLERMPLLARIGRLRSQYVTATLLNAVRTWCRNHAEGITPERLLTLERRIASIQSTLGRQQAGASSLTPNARPKKASEPGRTGDLRVRNRRRLADRRSGTECRSGRDRRQDSRRQRESNGRRRGIDRRSRNGIRRSGTERRKLRDRRGLTL